MDKRTEELFDKTFEKIEEISNKLSASNELGKTHVNDLKYIRGRMDTLSAIASNNAARLDVHITEEGKSPERVSAWAAVASVVVAILCLCATCYLGYSR